MKRHNFKKSLGQNFFKNNKFPNKLADTLDLQENDLVLEVGPGDGSVTKVILEKSIPVVAVEYDYDLLSKLLRRFQENKLFTLHHQDFLLFNLEEFINTYPGKSIKVVGSLPYNISKKIIRKLLLFDRNRRKNGQVGFEKLSFIIQDEVAKTYVSAPPKASFLSNFIHLFGRIRKLESISETQFTPRPKVKGAILTIIPELLYADLDFDEFLKFLKIGFITPRKKLTKNLISSNKYSREKIEDAFAKLEIDTNIRPAQLDYTQWVKAFGLITK